MSDRPRPLASVSGSPACIYLGLGANLGNREGCLEQALKLLAAQCGPFCRSSIYETPPWGDPDQPPFLNLVARGQTQLGPCALLARIKEAEQLLGRTPSRRWGPREIDVDLLAYGDAIIGTDSLQVPHARLHERAFVLVPLAEVAPNWTHPVLAKTACELLLALPAAERSRIRRWSGG